MKRDLLDNPDYTNINDWADWREQEGYKHGRIVGVFIGIVGAILVTIIICLLCFGVS